MIEGVFQHVIQFVVVAVAVAVAVAEGFPLPNAVVSAADAHGSRQHPCRAVASNHLRLLCCKLRPFARAGICMVCLSWLLSLLYACAGYVVCYSAWCCLQACSSGCS